MAKVAGGSQGGLEVLGEARGVLDPKTSGP